MSSSLLNKAKQLEKQLNSFKPQSRVLFFDSETEYEQALKDGVINENDASFIDDIANTIVLIDDYGDDDL